MYYIPSTYSPSFDMNSLFPVADATTGIDKLVHPGQRTLIIDFLDQRFQNLLNQIRYWDNDIWRGQKWPTLCYVYQGTTSLWFFNLAFNGLDTPMQLQAGMQVRFPKVSEIQRILSIGNSTNAVGQSISIGPPNIVGQP